MIRRTLRKLAIPPAGGGCGGGIPFYGNMYQGALDRDDLNPPAHPYMKDTEVSYMHEKGEGISITGPGTGKKINQKKVLHLKGDELNWKQRSIEDEPEVKAALDRCPYFALCDMCVWHRMDPQFLDPGVLSTEEHHLLLLFSRAYYEKWRVIHARMTPYGVRIRKRIGPHKLLKKIFTMLGVDSMVMNRLLYDYWLDDSMLIGMNCDLWLTANLPQSLKGQIDCSCLTLAGIPLRTQEFFFTILEKMRTLRVVREDMEALQTPFGQKGGIVPFVNYRDAVTFFDFSRKLGVPPYSGQCTAQLGEVLDDFHKVLRTYSFIDEDTYFDFLYGSFYDPDFDAMFDPDAVSCSKYVVRVRADKADDGTEDRPWE